MDKGFNFIKSNYQNEKSILSNEIINPLGAGNTLSNSLKFFIWLEIFILLIIFTILFVFFIFYTTNIYKNSFCNAGNDLTKINQ